MNPNETLHRMRAAALRISEGRGGVMDAATLALDVTDLDNWICGGGGVPDEWAEALRETR